MASRRCRSRMQRWPRERWGCSWAAMGTRLCSRGSWSSSSRKARAVTSRGTSSPPMRILQLAAVLALVAIWLPSEPGSTLADTTRMVEVIDPATIDVQMDSGASQRIRLVGIASDFARDNACAEARARSRAQELLEGQALSIDVQPDQALGSDVPAAAYVWLSDGQNLAETLLREGDVLASVAEWHPRQTSFAAAEAAAIADHAGIWEPGACSSVSGDTQPAVDADQAGIGGLVASSALSLPQARTAVQVL